MAAIVTATPEDDIPCFDGDIKEKPFSVKIKGEVKKFWIREMTGTDKDLWTSAMSKMVEFDPVTGIPTKVLSTLGAVENLITKCVVNNDRSPIDPKTIMLLPSATVDKIFQECQKFNGMDKEKTAVKNDLPASTVSG